MATLTLPAPLRAFFSYFPLYTYPDSPSKPQLERPTLWIVRPRGSSILSTDVECLKWQAYIALRGVRDIALRWDVSQEGAIDERFPNLQVPISVNDRSKGGLLPALSIPQWVDENVGNSTADPWEGYKDEAARDESHAWVALLEGNVHAALLLSQPEERSLLSLIAPKSKTAHPIETLLSPPPPPLSGLGSLFPIYGSRVSNAAIDLRYREAMAALSERLGTDKWFLGSSAPTALDALVFAYLHSILHANDSIRIEVTRRVNLVAWEWRVRGLVSAAFEPHFKTERATRD